MSCPCFFMPAYKWIRPNIYGTITEQMFEIFAIV